MTLDLSGIAVADRLRRVALLAGGLRPESRLDTKIDLTARGVTSRLTEASELLALCRRLARAGRAAQQ